MSRDEIDIHAIREAEFEAVCAHLPGRSREQHANRLRGQAEGNHRYLIAWDGGVPVGHVMTILPNDRFASDVAEFGERAIVGDLWVQEPFRGHGIGRALMLAFEEAVRGAGLSEAVLATGMDAGYGAARELYGAMGWRDLGGVYMESSELPADAAMPYWFEVLTLWTKKLFEVRVLVRSELEALMAGMPSWNADVYADRLAAQQRGELVQVVAWAGRHPVGRGMILFPEHEEYSPSAERERCAEVRDVGVAPAHRRRGVATAMMRSLERVAGERRFERIGLSTAEDAEAAPAPALYAGLGYRHAHGPYISSAWLRDNAGRRLPVGAVMSFSVKEL